MGDINNITAKLEFAQIGWVVPDIEAAAKFLSSTLVVTFPKPELVRAQDLKMTYYGEVVDSECLTTQIYNGGAYIELIQPLSGKSMFRDYLDQHPAGGTQHLAFRLPANDFIRVTNELREQGYAVMRMCFFDTYQALGVATEIMGITPEGWKVLEQMEKPAKKN
jgi:hypothetical protein